MGEARARDLGFRRSSSRFWHKNNALVKSQGQICHMTIMGIHKFPSFLLPEEIIIEQELFENVIREVGKK